MNSKDINDPIINMILAEGKWDIANVKISNDAERYYVETFIKLDEELDQAITRLDESVSDDDIVEELLEELETLAEKQDLSDDEYIFANVLESRLDEILGRLLRGAGDMARRGVTGVKNVADKAKAFYQRGKGDRLGAARTERGIEVRKNAENIRKRLRQHSDREAAGIKKAGGMSSYLQSPEAQRAKKARQTTLKLAVGDDLAKGLTAARKRREGSPGTDYATSLAQGDKARARSSMKRAGERESSVSTTATTKFRGGTDAERRKAFNARNKGQFQKGNKPVKKSPPPEVSKEKKTEGDLAHTEYQGEGMTLAESIIHNVKNRLL